MRLLPRSPRGTWILAGVVWGVGCTVLWWGWQPQPHIVLTGEQFAVGFMPDGKTFLTTTQNGSVISHDVETGAELARFSVGRTEPAPHWVSANLSNDGRFLAWQSPSSASVLIWDLAAGQPFADLPTCSAAFSPDTHFIAGAFGKRGRVRVWDLTQSPPNHLDLDDAAVDGVAVEGCVSFSEDGCLLAAMTVTPDGNGAVTWWRTATWEVAGQWVIDLTGVAPKELLDVNFLPDGRLAAVYPGAPGLLVMDPSRGTDSATIAICDRQSLKFRVSSHDCYVSWLEMRTTFWGSLVPLATRIGLPTPPGFERVQCWSHVVNLDSWQEVCTIPGAPVASNRWSPDGRFFATLIGKDQIAIWDIPPRKPLSWVLAGSTLLALPLVGMAWWSVRRIQRAARAATSGN